MTPRTLSRSLAAIGAVSIVALATARLSRFVTTDTLGDWTIVQPAKRWAQRREPAAWVRDDDEAELTPLPAEASDELIREAFGPVPTWRTKLVTGLECPFCIGFWLGGVTLAAWKASTRLQRSKRRPARAAGSAVRLGLGALALNYIVGHVSARLDS